MYKTIFTYLLFVACISFSFGQPSAAISEEVKANVQQRVDAGVSAGIVVGVVDESGTHFYSYGVKSRESDEKVDEHTIFEIGSVSKTFSAIMLANMALNGELALEDPIQKYLPEGVTAPSRNGESVQLVHIANHTSSLPRMPSNFNPADPSNPYADYTVDLLYEFLNDVELTRDIGSKYEYSNYAMGLLGYTLAKTKGKENFEDLLVETITGPLGMDNTRVRLTPSMKRQLAMGHSGYEEVSNWDLAPAVAGAGGIRSNVIDMLKYIKANMGMTKTDLYPAMQLSHQKTTVENIETEVGLGWHLRSEDDLEIVAHGGATGGYRSFAGFLKGGKIGVVVLSNSNAGVQDIGAHILNPKKELKDIKPSVGFAMRDVIAKDGIDAGIKAYHDMKNNHKENYYFSNRELNDLGYYYMLRDELEKSATVLKLNVEEYPEESNPYDSYGEVLMKLAIANYKKSVELNPANQNGIQMLKKMGVNADGLVKEVTVSTDVLERYVGKYQLATEFIITVTRKGEELFAQATGQAQFQIFPKSETEFYLKVVEAAVTFNLSDQGEVESLTLHQNGRDMPGKRL